MRGHQNQAFEKICRDILYRKPVLIKMCSEK